MFFDKVIVSPSKKQTAKKPSVSSFGYFYLCKGYPVCTDNSTVFILRNAISEVESVYFQVPKS